MKYRKGDIIAWHQHDFHFECCVKSIKSNDIYELALRRYKAPYNAHVPLNIEVSELVLENLVARKVGDYDHIPYSTTCTTTFLPGNWLKTQHGDVGFGDYIYYVEKSTNDPILPLKLLTVKSPVPFNSKRPAFNPGGYWFPPVSVLHKYYTLIPKPKLHDQCGNC